MARISREQREPGHLDVEPMSRREYWAQYEGPADVTSVAVLFAAAPPLYDVRIE